MHLSFQFLPHAVDIIIPAKNLWKDVMPRFLSLAIKGKSLAYDVDSGLIAGSDGEEYAFGIKEWISDIAPLNKMPVSFAAIQHRAAKVQLDSA